MKVLSPTGSFVVELMQQDGARVSQGDILLRLDDTDERQEIARIERYRKMTADSIAQLNGEQTIKKRRIIELSRIVASAYSEYLSRAVLVASDRAMIGELTQIDVEQLKAEDVESKSKLEKAEIMGALFEENVSYNLSVAQIALDHAESEMAFARQKLGEMTIRAPIEGVVRMHVGIGSFVKLGSLLAEIEN
jgi:membrane fusion protein, multidrug efflux system